MSDEIVRKYVKPAHEGACIPDPAHRQDLPQGGMQVVWDHYWRGREMSGDIIVSDAPFLENKPEPVKAEVRPGDPPKADMLKTTEIAKPVKG